MLLNSAYHLFVFSVTCDPVHQKPEKTFVNIGWVVRKTLCFEEYLGPEISVNLLINKSIKLIDKLIQFSVTRLLKMVLQLPEHSVR